MIKGAKRGARASDDDDDDDDRAATAPGAVALPGRGGDGCPPERP
jgi:hypothetical protein